MRVARACGLAVVAALALGGAPAAAAAQSTPTQGATPDAPSEAVTAAMTSRNEAPTRAALTAALTAAQARGDRATVERLRTRLAEGDFRPGDRLMVTIVLDTAVERQAVVREGPRVDLPPVGTLNLRGVLRSEAQDVVTRFYTRYYRNPEVRVQSLVRVGFNGAVPRPGFYSVPPDVPVADALREVAGGTNGNANLGKIEVRRVNRVIVSNRDYARAAREGLTFDDLRIRAGDEVRVPERKQRNIGQIVQFAFIGLSALTSLLFLIRSAYN